MRLEGIDLGSGRWHGAITVSATESVLELEQPVEPGNKMRVPLPDDWRSLSREQLTELARRPEVRLWVDDAHILWRVSLIGPGTAYPYPLPSRHVVFDSDRTWAGIVPLEPPTELGDLTGLELLGLRDHMRDFGGRRCGYRAPRQATDRQSAYTPNAPLRGH